MSSRTKGQSVLTKLFVVLSALLLQATAQTGSALAAGTRRTQAPTGLVGWWRAEGNAKDSVDNNHGELLNGAGFAPGRVGQAFAFDGISALVSVPDSPSLNPTDGLTLEARIRVSEFSENDSVAIAGKDDPYSPRQYMLGIGNVSGEWVFRAHVGVPTGYHFCNGATALQKTTWYHVAMTYDGSVLKLFVNGRLDGSLAVSGPIVVTGHPLLVGGHASGPWNFNGLVDELRLYNRALSSREILARYKAGGAGEPLQSPKARGSGE